MILIKSGTLVTADRTYKADILVEDEKIWAIGANFHLYEGIEITEEIDASGKLILPGGIDPHVHLALEMFDTISSDDHYTGHKAAAFGGTTTVMDFIPQPDDGPRLLHPRLGEDEQGRQQQERGADADDQPPVVVEHPQQLADRDRLGGRAVRISKELRHLQGRPHSCGKGSSH